MKHINPKQKKAGEKILISDKMDFKTENIFGSNVVST